MRLKTFLRRFLSQGPLFVTSITVWTAAGCMAEKKVASAISATDTAARPVSGATPILTDERLGVRLVDRTDTEGYYSYKVEVTLDGRVDTIPRVLTFDMPIVTPDGVLHGAAYAMDGPYAGIYSYDPRTRAVSTIPLPRDAAGWDNRVMLSPDASHIAYVGQDSTGSQGIVRTWPAAAVVLTTLKAPQAPSDYSFNQVWWVNRDSVEFLWHTDLGRETKPSDPRFPFLAIYASLPGRRFTVDTLKEPPNFRAAAER